MVNDNPLRIQDVSYEDLSPMMKQYVDLKKSLGSTLLFYRLGDFYEMFFDDAIYASNALELTLTARDCEIVLAIRKSKTQELLQKLSNLDFE